MIELIATLVGFIIGSILYRFINRQKLTFSLNLKRQTRYDFNKQKLIDEHEKEWQKIKSVVSQNPSTQYSSFYINDKSQTHMEMFEEAYKNIDISYVEYLGDLSLELKLQSFENKYKVKK